ncbi:MAG: CpcT/CpeT family chromophore lyase [Myxococcota bacterium]|nr:CpcT/CpeT family chromophore lyase [Myxococcota bacterium]
MADKSTHVMMVHRTLMVVGAALGLSCGGDAQSDVSPENMPGRSNVSHTSRSTTAATGVPDDPAGRHVPGTGAERPVTRDGLDLPRSDQPAPVQPMNRADDATPNPGPNNGSMVVPNVDLNMAYQAFIGEFDNHAQADLDPQFSAQRLVGCALQIEDLGQRLVYLRRERAMDDAHVQWVYAIRDNGDGRIAAVRYHLADERNERPSCAADRPTRLAPTALFRVDGCTLYFQPTENGFKGSTEGRECVLDWIDGAYVNTEVHLLRDEIRWMNVAYTASHAPTMNLTDEPYIFERSASSEGDDEPPMINPGAQPLTRDPADDDQVGMADESEAEPSEEMVDETADVVLRGGETCVDAIALEDASEPLDPMVSSYTHRIVSTFGATDDYNPQQDSGLAPGCSIVYSASGHEVVFQMTLQPGQSLDMRLTMSRRQSPGGLYMLNGCDPVTVPDFDGNGLCGDDIYQAVGHCGAGCGPLAWNFTWPALASDGLPNDVQNFFLVVDEVGAAQAGHFTLDWRLIDPP